MTIDTISYKMNHATPSDIQNHLTECDKLFIPPLSQRIEIADYATKISQKADTFEAWFNNHLIGLVAVYCNNKKAYITNVSIIERFSNRGISSTLLSMCIKHIEKLHFNEITLKVHQQNKKAQFLYRKHNFHAIEITNEIITMRKNIDVTTRLQ